jgi:hypothetical protein
MQAFARGETDTLEGLNERALPFPDRFDLRSARVRAMLVWDTNGNRSRVDCEGNGFVVELLQKADTLAYRHIFATTFAGYPSPGNLITLPTQPGVSARSALQAMSDEIAGRAMPTIGLHPRLFEMLREGKAEQFVSERARHLAQLERAFMQDLDIQPAQADVGVAEIDTA